MAPSKARRRRRQLGRSHRDRMRALGLRLIQLWVPDTRTAAFRNEAHRQSLAVAQSPHAREDQEFIDAITISDVQRD